MTTAEKLHNDSVAISTCLVLRKVVLITYCGCKNFDFIKKLVIKIKYFNNVSQNMW